MAILIRNLICDHFCEDAYGRDGHGHASKSKETLYNHIRFFHHRQIGQKGMIKTLMQIEIIKLFNQVLNRLCFPDFSRVQNRILRGRNNYSKFLKDSTLS
jgi:hypothetical protein